MYKIVYRDRRIAILKDVSQLLRFLNPVYGMKCTFKVYKSKKKGNIVQSSEHTALEHLSTGCDNWTDWSNALHESCEIDTLNTFYSGIEA